MQHLSISSVEKKKKKKKEFTMCYDAFMLQSVVTWLLELLCSLAFEAHALQGGSPSVSAA